MQVTRLFRVVLTVLACALGILGSPAPAAAQTLTPEQLEQLREQMRGRQVPEAVGSASSGSAESAQWMTQAPPLLDRPISRTEYQLGPGDRLTLSIFGYRSEIFPLTVTPEGSVIIPTVGIVPVMGLNLDEATRRVRQRVRRFFPDSEVEVSLAGVRSFKVFVVGASPEPGIETATAVTRVSEIVPAASENGVIYRNLLIRRGADTLRVDLARFLRTGDVADNPFLKDGDIIQVPRVDATVTIGGEVAYPGTYEFRQGETLRDLVRIGNGAETFRSRAADTLFLMRYASDRRGEILPIARRDAEGEMGRTLVLQPFDALFVPAVGSADGSTVTVEGEVDRPGVYPLRRTVTTVRDVVEMAGGFTADASPGAALLQRATSRDRGDSRTPLSTIPPEILSREERQIMQVLNRADEQNIVIDLSAESPALDLPLLPGDVLVVPNRRREVVVIGAVHRPGLVIHHPGLSLDEFVEGVGGYTRDADTGGVMVLRAETGARLRRRDVDHIQPGDRIVVPFRERTTFMERVQTTQGIINTVSGLVLTIVGLERLWGVLTN